MGLIMLLCGSFEPVTACTGIFYGKGNIALVGNNEDWKSPFTKIWFIPAEGKKFGRICFGFQEGGYQGGMNDQGLCYDGFALGHPATTTSTSTSTPKETYPGDLVEKIMEECGTVEEAVGWFEKYDRQFLASAQLFFSDRTGHSAIIEGEAIVRKEGDFQIVTNFRQSEVSASEITDKRYLIARSLLESSKPVDVSLFRRILADTHQEGTYPTQYSNIYDLKNGIIYLYSFHNYESVVVLNLKEELAKGRRVIDLKSLFPEMHAAIYYQKQIQKEMSARLEKEKMVQVAPAVLGKFPGKYYIASGSLAGYTIQISLQDNKLQAQAPFMEKLELFPVSETDYIIIGLEETIAVKFLLSESGQPTQLTLTLYGEEALAKKQQ